jgi:hypothetical protein
MKIKWHQEQQFAQDMPDDEWMGVVGPRGWVVLSQDRKWHVRENERAAVRQHSLKCFYFPSANRWDSLCQIIGRHQKTINLVSNENGPFIFELKSNNRFYRVSI